MLGAIHNQLFQMHRRYKRLVMVAADTIMIPLALLSAFAMRLGIEEFEPERFIWWFLVAPVVAIPAFIRLGLYRAVVRYMGPQAAFAVLKGVTFATISLMILVLMFRVPGFPRSVFINFWLISVLYVGGSRFFIRAYFHWLTRSYTDRSIIAIYGAGGAGLQLASAIKDGGEYLPVAFIDDNNALSGSILGGIQIYSSSQLEGLVKDQGVTQVFLAMPSISASERQAILNRLEDLPVYVRSVPSMPDLLSGKLNLEEVRDIEIEDLLGRDAVPPFDTLLSKCIQGKSVMVTGAAGSIGSELCRQIIKVRPKCLVLFDISEFGLYNINSQLRLMEGSEEIEIVPLLSSIRHKPLLVKVLRYYKVDVIYHAAAYKHVPLVEHNIIAGVRNNVFGTLSVAKAAIEAKVKDFVMISTDKAVRPTNVMGATKRLAELMIQGLALEPGATTFCAVRFGNVLGSSGSVVPLFRRQIESGGPVTVTHPEVSRYFMTIPEAAQLVIQAGALARSGDIFVLDMGERLKIVDLAGKMIRLMGFEVKDEDNPLGSIEIKFTGLRPGEKLREELMIGDNLSGTEHSKILRAREMRLEWDEIEQISEELYRACDNFDNEKIRAILLHSIVGYRPDHEFVDAILNESTTTDIAEFDTNIAKFPRRQ